MEFRVYGLEFGGKGNGFRVHMQHDQGVKG